MRLRQMAVGSRPSASQIRISSFAPHEKQLLPAKGTVSVPCLRLLAGPLLFRPTSANDAFLGGRCD
jgi:hypothetical protein